MISSTLFRTIAVLATMLPACEIATRVDTSRIDFGTSAIDEEDPDAPGPDSIGAVGDDADAGDIDASMDVD